MALSPQKLAAILRVNHAGEVGAVRIYEGQRAVLGDSSVGQTLHHMQEQETVHRDIFHKLLTQHQVKPTVFNPLWTVLAYGMGYGSALLGKKAAMACTVAVEEVIEDHYQDQLHTLERESDHQYVKEAIQKCLAEEIEHRDIGLAHQAKDLPFYPLFSAAIKGASKTAIWLSKKL